MQATVILKQTPHGLKAVNPLAWDVAEIAGNPVSGLIPAERLEAIQRLYSVEFMK